MKVISEGGGVPNTRSEGGAFYLKRKLPMVRYSCDWRETPSRERLDF